MLPGFSEYCADAQVESQPAADNNSRQKSTSNTFFGGIKRTGSQYFKETPYQELFQPVISMNNKTTGKTTSTFSGEIESLKKKQDKEKQFKQAKHNMNQTPAGKTTAELFQRDFLSDDKHHLNKYWKNHWERKYDKDEKKPTGRKKFGSERSVNKEQFDFQKNIVKSPPSGSSSATVSDTAFNNLKQQSGAMSKWNFTRSAAESIGFNKYGSSYVMDNEFLFLGSLLVNNEKCDVITFLLNKEFLFYVDSSASSAGNAGLVGGSDQNQSKIEEKLYCEEKSPLPIPNRDTSENL